MIKDSSFYGDMKRDWTFNDDGVAEIVTTQDIEPYLKQNAEERDANKETGEFHKFASIPMVVVEDLLHKGLNIFDNNDLPRIAKEIEVNYPYLKTTHLKEF